MNNGFKASIIVNKEYFDFVKDSCFCNKCNLILNSPVDCGQCRLTYCFDCFKTNNCKNNCKSDKANCSRKLYLILKDLVMKCFYTECNEEFLYIDYIKHIKLTKHRFIKCGNLNCDQTFPEISINTHLKDCAYQQIKCEFCNCEITNINKSIHKLICSFFYKNKHSTQVNVIKENAEKLDKNLSLLLNSTDKEPEFSVLRLLLNQILVFNYYSGSFLQSQNKTFNERKSISFIQDSNTVENTLFNESKHDEFFSQLNEAFSWINKKLDYLCQEGENKSSSRNNKSIIDINSKEEDNAIINRDNFINIISKFEDFINIKFDKINIDETNKLPSTDLIIKEKGLDLVNEFNKIEAMLIEISSSINKEEINEIHKKALPNKSRDSIVSIINKNNKNTDNEKKIDQMEKNILSTIESKYFELSKCLFCKSIKAKFNFSDCLICKNNTCNSCLKECSGCKSINCINCSTCGLNKCSSSLCQLCRCLCFVCSKYFCPVNCMKNCNLCRKKTSLDCIRNCNHCFMDYCSSMCSKTCNICLTVVCNKCFNRGKANFKYCEVCKDCYCETCFEECSQGCSRLICKKCVQRCSVCNVHYCLDCGFKCECGVFICKKCDYSNVRHKNTKINKEKIGAYLLEKELANKKTFDTKSSFSAISAITNKLNEKDNVSNLNKKEIIDIKTQNKYTTFYCSNEITCGKKLCKFCIPKKMQQCENPQCLQAYCLSCCSACKKCSKFFCNLKDCSIECFNCNSYSCRGCSLTCICEEVYFCGKCYSNNEQISHSCNEFLNEKLSFDGHKTRSYISFNIQTSVEIKVLIKEQDKQFAFNYRKTHQNLKNNNNLNDENQENTEENDQSLAKKESSDYLDYLSQFKKFQEGNSYLGFTDNNTFLEDTSGDIDNIWVLKLKTGEVYDNTNGVKQYLSEVNSNIIKIKFILGKLYFIIPSEEEDIKQEINIMPLSAPAFDFNPFLKEKSFKGKAIDYFRTVTFQNTTKKIINDEMKDKEFFIYAENEGLIDKKREYKILSIIKI